MSGKMPVSWGVPAFCEYICPVGTLEGGIPLLSTHPELRRVIGTLFSVKMVILVITLVGCLSICRFFCKVMFPLGAIYGLLNKVSLFHMDVNMGSILENVFAQSIKSGGFSLNYFESKKYGELDFVIQNGLR